MVFRSGRQPSSEVQLAAQGKIIESLATVRGVAIVNNPGRITLASGAVIEVDGASADNKVVVEAYARQGRLKGAQLKKVAQDILKLAMLKSDEAYADTEAIIAFASSEALESVTRWLAQAAQRFDVSFVVVDIPQDLRDDIIAAQQRQIMVNADQVADDI